MEPIVRPHRLRATALIAGTALALTPAVMRAQPPALAAGTPHPESRVTSHATGTFDVKLAPQPTADTTAGLGRFSIEKTFHGDLDGTSKGEMLSAGSGGPGSSGVYVAIERVTGTLNGKRGSFTLHHTGVMTRGAPSLTITVVPDSGTEELAGLAGTMSITITGGKHYYTFDYTLPAAP
jgi:Protein of unknown function (DUF3224)